MDDAIAWYEYALAAWLRVRGARTRRIAVGDEDALHVLDVPGDGTLPAVVLLHGFSASGASQYGTFCDRLKPHVRRIVLVDLPGHGLSTTPHEGLVPERMADALGVALEATLSEPAVVFASSMSGGIAVHCALTRPSLVRALVLCSPSGAPFAPDELDRFARTFAVHSHAEALEFLDRLLPAGTRPRPRSLVARVREVGTRHAYAWGLRRQFNRRHLVALLRRIPTMRFLTPSELGALAMPVHLIWGQSDDILPPSHVAYYRKHLPPSATIETPAHFGHTPFLHHPDELAAKLLAFVRTLDA